MPWLDTGIESGNSHQQIYPGWIQESNLQTLHADVPWLDTGIESTIRYSQMCPGWIQESSPENSRQQIHPGKIQESDLELRQLIVIIFVLPFPEKGKTLVICDVMMHEMRGVMMLITNGII